MIKMLVLKKYIESLGIADNVHIGRQLRKKKKSIGIYRSKHTPMYKRIEDKQRKEDKQALKGHKLKYITLLVHWTYSLYETEAISKKLYNLLANSEDMILIPLIREPKDVGADNEGICEMVIELAVVYKPWWKLQ